METAKLDSTVVECSNAQTKDWHAWIDMMPPAPHTLHVIGEVYVPNPGVEPLLTLREPQDNPEILQLNLYLIQKPGMWPQVFVWKQVRYDRILLRVQKYSQVQIFCGDNIIADIPVQEVH